MKGLGAVQSLPRAEKAQITHPSHEHLHCLNFEVSDLLLRAHDLAE